MKLMRFLLALTLMLSMMLSAEAKSPEEFAAERAGYAAIKNMYEALPSKTDCVSKIRMVFNCPYAQGELRIHSLERPLQKTELDIGSINFNAAAFGDTVNFELPFYLVDNPKRFDLYFNFDDKWKKIGLDYSVLQNTKKDDTDDKSFMLDLIDHAVLLDEAAGQQIVRVSFDCQKLAAFINEKKPDDKQMNEQLSEENQKQANVVTKCFEEALRKTGTLDAIFNIDATTKRPLMVEFDMTPALINTLNEFAALDESVITGTSAILKMLASTSQLKCYVLNDYSGEFNEKEFAVPKKVLKAQDITKDFLSSAKIGSTKTR